MTIISFDGNCSSWCDLWSELESVGFVVNDIRNGRWLGGEIGQHASASNS